MQFNELEKKLAKICKIMAYYKLCGDGWYNNKKFYTKLKYRGVLIEK